MAIRQHWYYVGFVMCKPNFRLTKCESVENKLNTTYSKRLLDHKNMNKGSVALVSRT